MGSTGALAQGCEHLGVPRGAHGWCKLMESTSLSRTKNPALNERREDRSRCGPGRVPPPARRPDAPLSPICSGTRSTTAPSSCTSSRSASPARRSTVPRGHARELGAGGTRHGHVPELGLYEVTMTDTEVMSVWATAPEGHEALGRAIDAGRTSASPPGVTSPASTLNELAWSRRR